MKEKVRFTKCWRGVIKSCILLQDALCIRGISYIGGDLSYIILQFPYNFCGSSQIYFNTWRIRLSLSYSWLRPNSPRLMILLLYNPTLTFKISTCIHILSSFAKYPLVKIKWPYFLQKFFLVPPLSWCFRDQDDFPGNGICISSQRSTTYSVLH